MKIDDEIVDIREWGAVRVPPGTRHGYEAGPEGLEILVVGAPLLADRRADVDGDCDWWTRPGSANGGEWLRAGAPDDPPRPAPATAVAPDRASRRRQCSGTARAGVPL